MRRESAMETQPEIHHAGTVLRSAIASRLLLIVLILLWRSLLTPYDTSASINPSRLTTTADPDAAADRHRILFPRIAAAIEDSIVWDSVYFVRIAQCGYEYEQSYAFLPLLPACILLLSRTVFAPLVLLVGRRAVLGISGYAINNIAFVFAALYLHRSALQEAPRDSDFELLEKSLDFIWLSLVVLKDPEAALRASILFCFNPASVFYTSIYTESLFALLSIGGVYHLMLGANNIATVFLALSGSARSNGVLNAGYICFQTMHSAYDAIFLKKNAHAIHEVNREDGEKEEIWDMGNEISEREVHKAPASLGIVDGEAVPCLTGYPQVLIAGAFRCVCIFVPFVAFQAYGYYNMCLGRSPDEIRPWCRARIPSLYNYIQSHYWYLIIHSYPVATLYLIQINTIEIIRFNFEDYVDSIFSGREVGFLRYFQLKQLPNFVLAFPILSLALCSIIDYVKLQPDVFFSLGFQASPLEQNVAAVTDQDTRTKSAYFSDKEASKEREDDQIRMRKPTIKREVSALLPSAIGASEKPRYVPVIVLPFVLHLGFMVATAFFVMHVQVSTRFLSASPPLYWFASYLMASPSASKRWGYLIWAYCAAYILLGSLLFSNFYPFT
ncbi:hypothetical protein RJ639_010942 [Escallonia herrerae]|uniref:GPI mannosyltransferase 2 n=1 Tax=Escallonia herrerae TaxID=1293975 RepID=A0AA88VRF1_9ASTE|nr:hypothetical protein RJ639_010942 [Escallonia herrerae]